MDTPPQCDPDNSLTPERRKRRNQRALTVLLMFAPLAACFVLLPWSERLVAISDGFAAFPIIALLWTAGAACLFARTAPPGRSTMSRIVIGLLAFFGVGILHVIFYALFIFAAMARGFQAA